MELQSKAGAKKTGASGSSRVRHVRSFFGSDGSSHAFTYFPGRRPIHVRFRRSHAEMAVLVYLFHQLPHLSIATALHSTSFRLLSARRVASCSAQKMGRCRCRSAPHPDARPFFGDPAGFVFVRRGRGS